MKTTHIVLAIFLFVIGQHSTKAQTGFALGFSGGYLFSYRSLNSDGSTFANTIKKVRNDMESPLLGASFSVDGMYAFKNNLILSSALSMQNIGYQIKDWDVYFGDAYPPGQTVKKYDDINIRYRLTRLSVPLMVGYDYRMGSTKQHAIMFSLGVSNNFTLQTKAIVILTETDGDYERESEDSPNAYNVYNLSACTHIAYYYNFDNSRIGGYLSGDYAITPNTRRDAGVRDYYYFGGLHLSYLYTLK